MFKCIYTTWHYGGKEQKRRVMLQPFVLKA